MNASDLVAEIRVSLRDVEERIRRHPWLDALEGGAVSRDALAAFAEQQLLIIPSDLRSFAGMLERRPDEPARGYLEGMVEGERVALDALWPFARAVGARDVGEPIPGCQAYPAYVAQLSRDGTPADVAGAFLVNLDAWGANCARMRDALRNRYDLAEDGVRFFALFSESPPDVEARSLAVIDEGLRKDESPKGVARAALLLQAYELLYWDSLPG